MTSKQNLEDFQRWKESISGKKFEQLLNTSSLTIPNAQKETLKKFGVNLPTTAPGTGGAPQLNFNAKDLKRSQFEDPKHKALENFHKITTPLPLRGPAPPRSS